MAGLIWPADHSLVQRKETQAGLRGWEEIGEGTPELWLESQAIESHAKKWWEGRAPGREGSTLQGRR